MNTITTGQRLLTGLAAAICMTLATCHEAQAQRTMNDRNLLTVDCTASLSSAKDFGAAASWGRYLLDGFWEVSASAVPRGVALSTGDRMDLLTLRAEGGYMHRLASTRSRSLSLYGGGTAFIGYELYDPSGRLPSNINTGLPGGAFVYGVRASVEAEVFITRTLAFVIRGSVPMTFGSVTGWLRVNAGAGLRLNI